uniref:Uncharacterized protein n=1 Tax=Alexandrium andersonii TaxID=327968 RepID=A0A7S2GT35_9DINO
MARISSSVRPRRAAAKMLGLAVVASSAALLLQGAHCFAQGVSRAGASQQLAQRGPAVARRALVSDDSRRLDESEREVSGGEIVKGFVAGSVLAIGSLLFGALAISGAVVPAPVGLAICLIVLLGAIYASLKGAKQNSGEEVDWVSGKDIKPSNEVVFYWPWLKKGEAPTKAGPLSFF